MSASPTISVLMKGRYVNEEKKRLAMAPQKTRTNPTPPTATLIFRLRAAASSAARRRGDRLSGFDSNTPHSTSRYLMAPAGVCTLHKRFVRRPGWSAGHGGENRVFIEAGAA